MFFVENTSLNKKKNLIFVQIFLEALWGEAVVIDSKQVWFYLGCFTAFAMAAGVRLCNDS